MSHTPTMAPRAVSAKEAALLAILAHELACAEGAWAQRRSQRDDELRQRKVRARLRYRSFFRSISGWHQWPAVG